MTSVDAVVPTYRRPDLLAKCLEALSQQSVPPRRVLVTVRLEDETTRSYLNEVDLDVDLQVVLVDQPGVVFALNRALEHVDADIVAFFDDDTAPDPDWIERAVAHYDDDPTLAGLGGRDRLVGAAQDPGPAPRAVGSIDWWGRMNGFHHHEGRGARAVDVLKGCNMSFRRTAIASLQFDERLLGAGAQMCNDAAFSLAVRRRGGSILFDPSMQVDHYHGPRWDRDQRRLTIDSKAREHEIHNETLTLLEHLPSARGKVYLVWATLCGTRDNVGILQSIRLAPKLRLDSLRLLVASARGRIRGYSTWKHCRPQQ